MRSAARNACSVDCQEDREDKRLKRLTDIARDVGVEAAEDDATLGKAPGAGRALLDDHAAHVVWDGAGELPADDASVLLACGPGGGAQCVDGKVRVGGEELDEAAGVSGEEERVAGEGGDLPLADSAGGAEDADLDLGGGHRGDGGWRGDEYSGGTNGVNFKGTVFISARLGLSCYLLYSPP